MTNFFVKAQFSKSVASAIPPRPLLDRSGFLVVYKIASLVYSTINGGICATGWKKKRDRSLPPYAR
ncbi:hypothetical protein [Microcoleus sp. FACHB-831]|uniref:hypothetical protein n=1 Tax=Microcoleus sp. FACHB-831 TaxID=2692827 RepID=UPI0016840BE0|nr:hypothetical protein [Microcoleus sp. FACHB-831]